MNGAAEALIGAAAADIAGQGGVDIGIRGLRVFPEERRGRHELSRHTIAALGNIQGNPGLLDRMAGIRGEAFDGDDFFAGGVGHRRHTGAHGLPVEMNGTGAALGDAAAVFGAGESERIPQNPEERGIRTDVDGIIFTVNFQALASGTSWKTKYHMNNSKSGWA